MRHLIPQTADRRPVKSLSVLGVAQEMTQTFCTPPQSSDFTGVEKSETWPRVAAFQKEQHRKLENKLGGTCVCLRPPQFNVA